MPGPLLLGYASSDKDVKLEQDDSSSWNSLPKHRDEDQVQLDVDRSFIYYPNGTSFPSPHITIPLTHPSHRPILQRDPPPKSRTLRPDKGSATTAALPLLFPGLPRHLPGLPTGARTTRSCSCCGTPLNPPNQGLYAPDPRARARSVTSHTCYPL